MLSRYFLYRYSNQLDCHTCCGLQIRNNLVLFFSHIFRQFILSSGVSISHGLVVSVSNSYLHSSYHQYNKITDNKIGLISICLRSAKHHLFYVKGQILLHSRMAKLSSHKKGVRAYTTTCLNI